MRVLDLSHNNIDEEVIKEELIPNLKINKYLTNVDLRKNPCFSIKVKKLVALCLLRNIDKMRNAHPPVSAIGKSWLNPACLI